MEIYLRDVQLEDGKLIVRWRNAPNVSSHSFNKKVITEETNEAFFHEFVETGRYKQFIVEKCDDYTGVASYPIATIYLKDMDITNKRCELCIFTSDDEEWDDDCKAIAIKKLLDKAFNEFGMHKVYSYVFMKYLDEAELLKKAGFIAEAILGREAVDEDGNYCDVVRYSVINPNM